MEEKEERERETASECERERPVHLIITMIKWIRTSRLSIKNSLPRWAAGPDGQIVCQHSFPGWQDRIHAAQESQDSLLQEIQDDPPPEVPPLSPLEGAPSLHNLFGPRAVGRRIRVPLKKLVTCSLLHW